MSISQQYTALWLGIALLLGMIQMTFRGAQMCRDFDNGKTESAQANAVISFVVELLMLIFVLIASGVAVCSR